MISSPGRERNLSVCLIYGYHGLSTSQGSGSSWRLDGAKAMLAVCRRKEELKNNAFKPYVKRMVEQKGKEPRKYICDHGMWLQAGAPVLHLSHANRPCEAPFGLGFMAQG